ncbi:hypothetical protein E2562_001859 [Oryza meyeriana var. granulata]|uniref:Uncharacterized protein n=1 Tax=Oryza meyeriana var. granulata TaxID=110450 RepID=A0A6G1C3L6_9ORYZ|nr:hypothetical protein E2562_001859 [Oryza meyeriana var. granulata]
MWKKLGSFCHCLVGPAKSGFPPSLATAAAAHATPLPPPARSILCHRRGLFPVPISLFPLPSQPGAAVFLLEPPRPGSVLLGYWGCDRWRVSCLSTVKVRLFFSFLSRKMVEHLFEDIFTVTRLDPDGKKFDRVSRIEARSEQFDMYMQLDVATEVYPMRPGDKFTMVLAPTLNLDGTPDTGFYTQAGRKTLADKFDYVMHGKLYKISEDSSSGQATKVEIYASFGGLLMMLKGDPSSAASFELDQRLFLLIRKV